MDFHELSFYKHSAPNGAQTIRSNSRGIPFVKNLPLPAPSPPFVRLTQGTEEVPYSPRKTNYFNVDATLSGRQQSRHTGLG